jgi:hypothetical protein
MLYGDCWMLVYLMAILFWGRWFFDVLAGNHSETGLEVIFFQVRFALERRG